MESCSVVEQGRSVVQGRVQSIIDHGTIIQMLVVTEEGGLYPVDFDHRMFFNMWENLGGVDLNGRRVVVSGERFVDQRVEFPDLEDGS